MKNILVTFLTLTLLVLNGCGGGGSSDSASSGSNGVKDEKGKATTSFDEALRGEWIYVHNGEKVYIDEDFKEPITKVDDKLLKIETDGVTKYLIRYGVNNSTVTGDLYKDSIAHALKRSVSTIGNINIILEHYLDEKNTKKQTITNTGNFEFKNVQTGKYTFKATAETKTTEDTDKEQKVKEKVTAKVDVYGEEINIGGFTLVNDDGYNFKTEFTINNSKGGYLFGDQTTYDGTIFIKNIGDKKGSGLNYTFTSDSPYISSMSNTTVLGTVDVNKSIEIPFEVTFNILDKSTVSIPVDVTIKDAHGNQWLDSLFFHVYQTPMNLNIATKNAHIKGYIIEDGHKLNQIDVGNETVILPYKAGGSYYLVLSNPDINNETAYSIGVDTEAPDFEKFQDTSAYEPNDKESEAKTIKMGESIISYLHEGDIDYFLIDMSSSEDVGVYSPPQMPFK